MVLSVNNPRKVVSLERIDVYDRLFVGMRRADSRDYFRNEFVCDSDFYPLLFHFFEFSDFADSGVRAFLRLESPDTPHAETTKRIVALFSSSHLPCRLSHFHRASRRHRHDNLFHIFESTRAISSKFPRAWVSPDSLWRSI